MKIDKSILTEVKELKSKYKISSRAAYRFLEEKSTAAYLERLGIDPWVERRIAPYTIAYFEYLIKALKGNRRFLETEMNKMSATLD